MAKNDPSNLWDVLLAFESHAREALRRKHPSTVHEAARNVLRYAGLVRFSWGKAIAGAANPSAVTDAVSAAVSLGCYFTGMLAKDMEPHAQSGRASHTGGKIGTDRLDAKTQASYDKINANVAARQKKSPRVSITEHRKRAAKELRISYSKVLDAQLPGRRHKTLRKK